MEPCQVGNAMYLPDGNGGVVIVTPDTFITIDKSGEQNEYERDEKGEPNGNGYQFTNQRVQESDEGRGRN